MAIEPTVERYTPPAPTRIKIELSEEEAQNLAILLTDGVYTKVLTTIGLRPLTDKLIKLVKPNPHRSTLRFSYQAELDSY